MRYLITCLLLLVPWFVYAPETGSPYYYRIIKVRILAYSPKERGESDINHKGKKIRNERGIAARSNFIPDGAEIILPDGTSRIKDDVIGKRAVRKFGQNVIDVRWHQSITAPPRSKAVKRQLYKKDMGWAEIVIKEKRK